MSDSDILHFIAQNKSPANYFIATFPQRKTSTLARALRNSGGMREVG